MQEFTSLLEGWYLRKMWPFPYCGPSNLLSSLLPNQSAWSMGPSCGTFHLAAELKNHGFAWSLGSIFKEVQKFKNYWRTSVNNFVVIPSNKLEWIQPSLWMEEIWDSPYWRLRIAGTYQPWMVENFVVSRQQAKYRPWVWDPLEIDCLQRFAPFFPFLGVTMVYPLVIQHSLCATAISRWFTCWKWWFSIEDY